MMMRDENHTKKRMMSDAQRNAKFNTAEEKVKWLVETTNSRLWGFSQQVGEN